MIRIDEITVSYGDAVLDKFSLVLPDEGIYCVLGPSGCGKTTLLRVISGLIVPQAGSVDTQNAKISVQFQEDRLLPWLTALQNVMIVNDEADGIGLLEALGLKEEACKYPAELSGGMRFRVALARAIAYGGQVLLLDEPFQGLDAVNKKLAMDLVMKQPGLKVIVTHDPVEIEYLGGHPIYLGEE